MRDVSRPGGNGDISEIVVRPAMNIDGEGDLEFVLPVRDFFRLVMRLVAFWEESGI